MEAIEKSHLWRDAADELVTRLITAVSSSRYLVTEKQWKYHSSTCTRSCPLMASTLQTPCELTRMLNTNNAASEPLK